MLDFENIVLSCIYFDQKKEHVNLGELSDKYFTDKGLFQKVVQYRKNNLPYDMAVACNYFSADELERFERGIDQIKSVSNYAFYYTELKKSFYESEIQKQIQSKNIDADTVQQYINTIKNSNVVEKIYNFDSDLHGYLDRFEERLTGKFERYDMQMQGFDEVLGYVRPKRYYTIGASPGVGKTNFMLEIMLKQMKNDVPCLFFTAEMDYDSLVERMGAINSGLRLFDILNAHMKPEQIQSYTQAIQNNLYGKKSFIFETPTFNVSKIKALIEKTKAKFIFVDYLQKFNLETKRGETRASVMNDIANGLKAISMEKNVVVFAGSQLDKHADRSDANLSNLKESGGIEEASDGIILLSEIAENEDFKKIKVHIAKNKYGILDQFVYAMDRVSCALKYSPTDTVNLKNILKDKKSEPNKNDSKRHTY
jgi:replicative DNA helicase